MSAHLAAAGGLFAAGAWKLELVDRPKLASTLLQPLSPPAPSGGPVAQVKPLEFKPKVHVVKETTQPSKHSPDKVVATGDPGTTGPGPGPGKPDEPGVCTENCGVPEQVPAAAVCGNGSVELGETCDDGNTADGDGCSATCRVEVRPKPVAQTVAPGVLSALRLSGTTQIRPDEVTQSQIARDGSSKVSGTVKLCVGVDGGVTSARMLASTRYPSYDATLLSAVSGWRYQPYSVGGVTVSACSTVTFIYRTE
ncbi:MAG TPA: hypothetical protein VGC42_02400 [Kofleriaceae bacterium]